MNSLNYIDISYQIKPEMCIYPGNPGFRTERVQDILAGDSSNVSLVSLGSHTGTHIDSPLHFISDGASLDEISLDQMNGRAIVADVTGHADIGVELIRELALCDKDIILFRTDNSLDWACDRVLDDYVTLTYEAADYLASIKIKLVGVDYLTIERPRSRRIKGKSVHKSLLGNGILICEGLNLKNIEAGEYSFFCFPLNIQGIDGFPVRCVLGTCHNNII